MYQSGYVINVIRKTGRISIIVLPSPVVKILVIVVSTCVPSTESCLIVAVRDESCLITRVRGFLLISLANKLM